MNEINLAKTYDFKTTEERIYRLWEERGYFQPSNDPRKPDFDPARKPFVISIPPPNVTGELHLGHVLFVAMEDLMIRYHRMQGIPTLWVPGTDHAGIATQLQIEKLLAKEGLVREQIGREEFLRRTWDWKHKYGGIITHQIRRIGASCDWSRERFTLDEGLSRAVREAFVRLYEKGLIYRGPRLINWSPGLQTAVSDLEVEYSEEPGALYYFRYLLADSDTEFLPVATTRPETILGDTAVAVNPEDERYRRFVGRQVRVPVLGRLIPVIADSYVDMAFGGGALKVTPAHDPNDYAIAQRFGLEMISILTKDARINENGGPYAGLDRFECRKKLWADMRAAGLVIKEEPYTLNVPRSQRGGEIIEPMISTQWFVSIKPLAEAALQAVADGRIRIVPERFVKVYYNWLENIQDWCISRQLWWGHRIPVWYCADCGEQTVARQDPAACAHCGSARIQQDEDVLDTWFSSGLWPFSTLGWPEETPDYRYFYPTTVMETGYDILFFWVARMIQFGLEFTGKAPFETVYLHGLIRDARGRKMSKSFGNAVDPLEVMNEMGADALRFSLLVGSTPGNDTNVDLKKVEANRNFANKLWNAARLVISAIPKAPLEPQAEPVWTLADAFIFGRLKQITRDVERLFQNYQYGEAGRQLYDFFWSDYADWYLEIAKLQVTDGGDRAFYTVDLLVRVLETTLRLLHPFIPFVTEEIYGQLRAAAQAHSPRLLPYEGAWSEALIIAPWPQPMPDAGWEEENIANFQALQQIVRAIRNLRLEKKVPPARRLPAVFASGEDMNHVLEHVRPLLPALAGLDAAHLTIIDTGKVACERPAGFTPLVAAGVEVFLGLAGARDDEAERARLQKELAELEGQIARLEVLLAGDFASKAPPAVVEKERQKLATYRESAAKLREQAN